MFRGTGDIGFRSITPSSSVNVALHSIELHGVVLRNAAFRSIGQRCTHSIASHNIRSITFHGTSSIAFGGTKKRDDARWTNKRLVALDKRDRIAPVMAFMPRRTVSFLQGSSCKITCAPSVSHNAATSAWHVTTTRQLNKPSVARTTWPTSGASQSSA